MTTQKRLAIGPVSVANDLPLTLIAGPCALESRSHALEMSQALCEMTDRLGIGFIYKSSFDKANRTSNSSPRGMGLEEALPIFNEVRETHGCPILTDVHEAGQCAPVADAVDVLQIPAFLCRQTDLLVAAANTGKVVNIKKGQFLSAESMEHAVKKVHDSGNPKAWLTERGTTFGYQDLVVDFRGLAAMRSFGPTIMDLTHSLQQPNQSSGVTGGRPGLIAHMARTAVAAGADGVFIETHPDPATAKSDGANMLALDRFAALAKQMKTMRGAYLDATG